MQYINLIHSPNAQLLIHHSPSIHQWKTFANSAVELKNKKPSDSLFSDFCLLSICIASFSTTKSKQIVKTWAHFFFCNQESEKKLVCIFRQELFVCIDLDNVTIMSGTRFQRMYAMERWSILPCCALIYGQCRSCCDGNCIEKKLFSFH